VRPKLTQQRCQDQRELQVESPFFEHNDTQFWGSEFQINWTWGRFNWGIGFFISGQSVMWWLNLSQCLSDNFWFGIVPRQNIGSGKKIFWNRGRLGVSSWEVSPYFYSKAISLLLVSDKLNSGYILDRHQDHS
jgi:hypothetical protein